MNNNNNNSEKSRDGAELPHEKREVRACALARIRRKSIQRTVAVVTTRIEERLKVKESQHTSSETHPPNVIVITKAGKAQATDTMMLPSSSSSSSSQSWSSMMMKKANHYLFIGPDSKCKIERSHLLIWESIINVMASSSTTTTKTTHNLKQH